MKTFKVLAVLLVVALLVPASFAPVSAQEDAPVVGVIVRTMVNDPFQVAMAEAAEKKAAELGLKAVVYAATGHGDVQEQQAIVEDLIQQKVAGILLAPLDTQALKVAMEEADAAGIPVVLFDSNPIEGAPFVTAIGTDNVAASALAADYLIEKFNGEAKVAQIEGEPGAQNALFRVQGFQNRLKEAPGMELVASQTGHWTTAGAMQAMENILQAHPDLDAVFASSDMMGVGALQALQAAGKEKEITLVTFDGIPEGIQLIKDGYSDADVAQFPTKMGEMGIEVLHAIITGEKTAEDFPKYIDSGAMLITPENADLFLYQTFGIGMPKWRGADKDPKDMTIVVVPKSVGHPYWADVEKGVIKGGEDTGANAIFNGPPQADINAQINLIEDYISTGVDGLAISPNDPTAIAPIISKAIEAGIPTITFDADAPNSDRLMYIGTDNVVGGDQLGQELVRLMEGEGKVVFLTGGLAALNLNQRLEGGKKAISQYPDIELVGIEAHNDNLEVAFTLVENVLTANPDLKAIYCASGATAAAKALKAQGKKPGEVIVVGFDVFDPTPEFIREGYIQAVVSQRPFLMGELSVKWLVDLNLGKKTPPESKVLDTGTILVTKENLEEYLSAPH